MCGRFTLRASTIELRNAFPFADLPELGPRYNISPTQQVAAIRRDADSPTPEFAWLRWGFLPPWAKTPKDRPQPINAKSETVGQSRMFAKALQARRCLLLADGFYEWRSEGKAKQPFYIRMKDEKPFAFAGIWTVWHGGGETVESCTMLVSASRPVAGDSGRRRKKLAIPLKLRNNTGTSLIHSRSVVQPDDHSGFSAFFRGSSVARRRNRP
jgi:putative SOS response-associated peptidase YedK